MLRDMYGMTELRIAEELGITPDEYIELETGALAMTPEQAEALAQVFDIDSGPFLESSRQLELLLTREEIIKTLQEENKKLNALMEGGYELIHQSKQSKAS